MEDALTPLDPKWTEEALGSRATVSYLAGRASQLEDLEEELLARAGRMFAEGRDELAHYLRETLAREVGEQAQVRRRHMEEQHRELQELLERGAAQRGLAVDMEVVQLSWEEEDGPLTVVGRLSGDDRHLAPERGDRVALVRPVSVVQVQEVDAGAGRREGQEPPPVCEGYVEDAAEPVCQRCGRPREAHG